MGVDEERRQDYRIFSENKLHTGAPVCSLFAKCQFLLIFIKIERSSLEKFLYSLRFYLKTKQPSCQGLFAGFQPKCTKLI